MYLVSIKRNPKSVLKDVNHGILLNFLKGEKVSMYDEELGKKKQLFKVQVERYILEMNDNLKLLDKLDLKPVYEINWIIKSLKFIDLFKQAVFEIFTNKKYFAIILS